MPTSHFIVSPPPTFILASVHAFITSPHPLSLSITHHCPLPAAAHLCRSSVNGWLLRLCPFQLHLPVCSPLHGFIFISCHSCASNDVFVAGRHPLLPTIASHSPLPLVSSLCLPSPLSRQWLLHCEIIGDLATYLVPWLCPLSEQADVMAFFCTCEHARLWF